MVKKLFKGNIQHLQQVNLGQHVVLSVQQEQAFWWPWTTVPHICSPSPEKFREALKSMVRKIVFHSF